MKKILIALALIFPAFFAAAQEIPAGMRMELAEISENDDQFSIFKYKDEDGSVAYYLSVGREFNVVEAVFGDVSNISLGHVDETVLCLGKTYDEAQAFLESMLALFDKELETTVEFPARLSVGAEKLGGESVANCIVVKRFLQGKHLLFHFISGDHTGESELSKANLKSLISSLKIARKLHPEK